MHKYKVDIFLEQYRVYLSINLCIICEVFCTHSMHISRMELSGFLQEGQAGVRVHHVLHKRHEVLGRQGAALSPRQDVDEPGRVVVALGRHPGTLRI